GLFNAVIEKFAVTEAGRVGVATGDPRAPLHVAGADATPAVETAEVARFTLPAVQNIKNTNSAGLFLGSFEAGITGRARLDVKLSGTPDNANEFGSTPDVTVLSLSADRTVLLDGG